MHHEVSFGEHAKFREDNVSLVHYLSDFYASVEPRHDETGSPRTRHFLIRQEPKPRFPFIAVIQPCRPLNGLTQVKETIQTAPPKL
jgi:hypothetical protein